MKDNSQLGQVNVNYKANCDVLFALAPLAFMAFYLYGIRPLAMLLLAMAFARLCDWMVAKVRRMPFDKTENSSLVYAAVFTLMLPATLPYRMVFVGVAAAVLLGKHAFGGVGSYPFNPAALGYAVVTVCWPDHLFSYPRPFAPLSFWGVSGSTLVSSGAHTLKNGGIPNIPALDLVLGSYAGPMGTTFCLVIVASAIFLVVRRRLDFLLPTSAVAMAMLVSLAFPRVLTAPRVDVMKYEILSGAVLFGAVFLLGNVTTAPKNRLARVLYGALAGFIAMMFRYYGSYELGICFAVLLTNAFSGALDRACSKTRFVKRRVSDQ